MSFPFKWEGISTIFTKLICFYKNSWNVFYIKCIFDTDKIEFFRKTFFKSLYIFTSGEKQCISCPLLIPKYGHQVQNFIYPNSMFSYLPICSSCKDECCTYILVKVYGYHNSLDILMADEILR